MLLVDLDLRSPTIHRYFGFEMDYGLLDYLEGKRPIPELLVHPKGIDGLVILPAGRTSDWAAELIRSPRMLELVPELKHFYPDRYVIFDLPPMLSFADALAFAPLVDGIIVVAEARKTSADDLRRCQEMLRDKPVLGYVFNKAEDFFLNIVWDRLVARILHITTINSEGRQSFLVITCQSGSKINCTGAFGSVKSPHGLW